MMGVPQDDREEDALYRICFLSEFVPCDWLFYAIDEDGFVVIYADAPDDAVRSFGGGVAE